MDSTNPAAAAPAPTPYPPHDDHTVVDVQLRDTAAIPAVPAAYPPGPHTVVHAAAHKSFDIGAPAPAGPNASNGHSMASSTGLIPFKWTRFGLLLAAFLAALAALVAQAVFMSHRVGNTYYSYDYFWGFSYSYSYSYKGAEFAKAPAVVVAMAAIAIVVAVLLIVSVFFYIVSASLWAAIVHVVLSSLVLLLWLPAVATSAKTASVLKKDWPKTWVAANAAALAFCCLSVLIWAALVVFSAMALFRVVRVRKEARARHAAAAGGPAPQYGAGAA